MARFTQNAGGSSSGTGSALNYVQVAGTQQTISSAPSTIVNLDITTTGSPVQVSVTGEGSNAAASSWVRINLFRDNIAIGNEIQVEASAISENVPFAINFIDDVAAGTYNYSARITSKSSGNWQFGEVAGPVINAVELTGFNGDDGANGTNGADGADGADGLDSLFLGTWNSVTEFLAAYQGGPTGLAPGDWWAFVKDNTNPNKIYVVREDPTSSSGWVIDDNEHFVLPEGPQGDPGANALWNFTGEYSGGASYAVGDIVTYDGQLWYRYNSNGGNVGDTPSPGLWNLLAAKGADGNDGAQGDPGEPGANGNDGSPGLVYLGNYISGNGYIANLAVVKGSDNNLYIATSSGGLSDPVGNTAEWAIFLPKGADGAPGADGADGADANLDTGTTTINSYNPVWSGTGLTYTNTPATGSYIKIGNLVTVQIDVLFTTVTNFGTGQYSLTLPFASKYHTDVYGGSVHKNTNQGIDHYSLKGHLAPTLSTFTVWAIGSSASDQPFNNNTPVGVDTDDKFHMSFSYICE